MYDSVQEYYGKVLASNADLKTNACCSDDSMPRYVKDALAKVHDEVLARYYGCGLVVPGELTGLKVLDLGSGSGRDCYVLSQLVGEHGEVVGIDMTDEQLAVAERHVDYHRNEYGYEASNTRFMKGYIEHLDQLDLEVGTFDLIISNCVINLSPDKEAVLRQAWNLLKPGGEMYFSDVYADRRIPPELATDPVLYGECLGGALYWNDFMSLAKTTGFADPRLVEDRPLTIENDSVASRVDPIRFFSATYRLFKLSSLEHACEDYGQAVVYKGTMDNSPHHFLLDKHHRIETGRIFPVCGNTWRMLADTRFARHFEFHGDWNKHFGLFEGCGDAIPYNTSLDSRQDEDATSTGCC
jgi:arsenite methyltransferase